jgi:serine/threonine protein kinase
MILGQGSYGEVKARDGKAVKKFSKLSHLIQEYMALRYLNDCQYIVHTQGADFGSLELYMDLYDCSLRKWLEDSPNGQRPSMDQIKKILHDMLMGLIELHDRNLAHGDLKPGNTLIRRHDLKTVLGDCGFVSIAKYAKVDRTAAIYRDPVISHEPSHDMFSFGICFLEMIADIKINRQASYEELRQVLRDKVADMEYRKILYNLLHEDKSRRPSARVLIQRLFGESPPQWKRQSVASDPSSVTTPGRVIVSIMSQDREHIRSLMKRTAEQFEINRGKKGYGALISYIDAHKIEASLFKIHAAVTLVILSSIFGKSGFRDVEAIELCENKYDKKFIYRILDRMLSDSVFLNILLAP